MRKFFYGVKVSFLTAVTMCVIMAVYTTVYNKAEEARLNKGAEGDRVVTIQEKLKELGLYDGKCDGVYDVDTAEAVKKFQEYNGIDADGVCGSETLEAMGLPIYSYRDYELDVLAQLIEAEAGGNTLQAMTSVGAVVMNRVKSDRFPDSIVQVVYSGGSFDSVIDGSIASVKPSELAYRAAEDATLGFDPTEGALYVLHGASYGKIVTLQCDDLYFAR